jgi:hypothetical protein
VVGLGLKLRKGLRLGYGSGLAGIGGGLGLVSGFVLVIAHD